MNELLAQAQQALAQGNKPTASSLLRQLVMQDPHNDAAWVLFADVVDKREHAIDCLKRAIAVNPSNQSAQRKLQALLNPAPTAAVDPTVSVPPMPSLAAVQAKLAGPVPTPQVSAAPPQVAPATKRCPYCAEEILAAAIVCKHCHRDLVTPSPKIAQPVQAMTPPAVAVRVTRQAAKAESLQQQPVAAPRPGSYVDSNLMPGERVLYRAHLHSIIYLRALVTLVFGVLVGMVALSAQKGTVVELGVIAGVCFGSFFAFVGLVAIVLVFLITRTTEFALTTRRLIGKRGIIRRHSLELLLTKVESVTVDQPIMGRLLNYGTIVVVGTGGTRERFGYIEDPQKLRQAVQRQIATQ